ncbi:DNA mismatch repair protein MutH [Oceanotoga sp. DSM 15011]|uniref:DNA mismatch repair protein MutH n=1 Tax=Oceanotoga sp. DSM 15011 TaxID=2984951 RepID=UPI0021F43D0E|nr:DNA mismatch repair protein MutH [Oceanotoga sp. DSM 15011]UYP00559.1 DNA mismatch repair protein MutH [Oceanotoga sp. DSM 15011]
MKLEEAKVKLERIKNIPLKKLLKKEDFIDIKRNKGKTGQLLELLLGLKNTNTKLDFEDGELKTNKVDKTGKPLETIFITQIKKEIDNLLRKQSFEESYIYSKIKNLLYVSICKEGDEKDWFIMNYIHVSENNKNFNDLYKQLKSDYYIICDKLNENIKNSKDGYIHTTSGKYIQIRSKDSKKKMAHTIRFFLLLIIEIYLIKIMHFILKKVLFMK